MIINFTREGVTITLAPPSPPATTQCIRANGILAFTSAVTGENPETGHLPLDFPTQMKNAIYNARAVLESARSDLLSATLVMIELSDAHYLTQMDEIYQSFFPSQDPPARKVSIVASLPKGALFQITIIAVARESI